MARTLEIFAPDEEPCRLEVRCPVRIGRARECELQLGYRGISRIHAMIVERGGRCFVRDNQSTNGTYVNDARIEEVALEDSDEIRVGPVRVRFFEAARFVDGAREATLAATPAVDFGSLPPSNALTGAALVREYEKQRAVVELTHRLGAETTERGVFDQVLDYCMEALPVENAVALVKGSDSDWLRRRAQRSRSGACEVEVSRTVIREVVERGTGLCVLDAGADPLVDRVDSVLELGLRSVLAVPLVVGNEVTGAFVLDNRREKRAFTEVDLHVVSGIAAAAGLALQRISLMRQVAEEARRRERLERLLSPAVVREVLDGQLELHESGRLTEVVVLFADVRGFTPLSRKLGPRRTLETLNAYYRLTVAEVDRYQGMVDKFVGDAIIAVWGIPMERADDGDNAIRCALSIHDRLRAEPILDADGIPLACGIGVHRGPAVVGMVGTRQRMQYTVIGDTVNLCARLCALASPGQLLVHQDLANAVQGPWTVHAMPEVAVKGFAEPQRLVQLRPDHGFDETTSLGETPAPAPRRE